MDKDANPQGKGDLHISIEVNAHYRRGDFYERPLAEHFQTATDTDRFLTQFEFHQQIAETLKEKTESVKPRPKWTLKVRK